MNTLAIGILLVCAILSCCTAGAPGGAPRRETDQRLNLLQAGMSVGQVEEVMGPISGEFKRIMKSRMGATGVQFMIDYGQGINFQAIGGDPRGHLKSEYVYRGDSYVITFDHRGKVKAFGPA
ncbi:MAG: hypothetical protein J0M04_18215 [Verrucomicrobia bacterium]|nr:hypothetical protein [Verrucomicrobiota bacterium]